MKETDDIEESLRQLMHIKAREMTPKRLAASLGISRSFLGDILSGRCHIPPKVAAGFGWKLTIRREVVREWRRMTDSEFNAEVNRWK